jgi:hypothetical protein
VGVTPNPKFHANTRAALDAFARGFQAVAIRDGGKKPQGSAWTHTRWTSEEEIQQAFDGWAEAGASGVGLLLGEPSGGLVDVDLDHTKALRLRDHLLPPSSMSTGRQGRARSHRWYVVKENLPATRQYRMPDRSMIIELRSTGAQTVIPPSTWWPSDWKPGAPTETYRWEGPAWGGAQGPSVIDGRKLAVQVALLAMGAVLLETWPARGGRHDAYLALAGGLLRFGQGVHPYWEKNLPVLIEAMADATRDEDGGKARVAEVMGTTLKRLRDNGKSTGFPRLAELIGADPAELVRRWARDVEALAGFAGTPMKRLDAVAPDSGGTEEDEDDRIVSTLPPEKRNPMEERISSWGAVDLEPYLTGQVVMPEPSVLVRVDGKGLMYPGRVNSLYGMSESAKSWIALLACLQEMDKGNRVIYCDLEDGPEGTLGRTLALGAAPDDISQQFRYVHPEGPLSEMQRYRFGPQPTEDGVASSGVFTSLLESFDPTLIIVDGMTVLYGLHGHDTNEATGTDVITSWLKKVCRSGRTTVIVIDHTGKTGGAGSSPIGAHHKVAMIQGTSLRVDVVDRPMRGAVGTMRLIVHKDRPGAVREISTKSSEQVAGVVTLDSTVLGISRMWVDVPDPDDVVVADSARMEAKLAKLAKLEDLQDAAMQLFLGDLAAKVTSVMVVDKTGCSLAEAREAWDLLENLGHVASYGVGRGRYYMLVG